MGYEELIGAKDYISIDSPIAQALLNKEVGDEVIVKVKNADLVKKHLDFNLLGKPEA